MFKLWVNINIGNISNYWVGFCMGFKRGPRKLVRRDNKPYKSHSLRFCHTCSACSNKFYIIMRIWCCRHGNHIDKVTDYKPWSSPLMWPITGFHPHSTILRWKLTKLYKACPHENVYAGFNLCSNLLFILFLQIS